jgi:integrase
VLSDATKAWLGVDGAARLSMLVGWAGAKIPEGSPSGWRSAYEAYLKANEARDTRAVVEGKAKAEEKTKLSRKYKLKVFVEWAEKRRLPFMKEPFTETIRTYIEHRKASGIQPGTLWSGEFTLLCCWGEWMASRRICEPINRDRVREVMPEKPVPVVKVPTWQDDLETLRFFYGKRLTDSSKGPQWKHNRCYYPLWSLVLVVRGLGCRPSEATALTRETVDLERSRVKFLKSKNNRSRIVPILFQWVHDGLVEAWERAGRPKSGPVCRKWDGNLWRWDVSAANLMQRTCEYHDRPVYQLKKAQKLHIAHLIRLGFPPHVVAYWTDHTLSIQEKHYYEGDGYLPPEDGWDYAEFGILSKFGELVRSHHGAYSKALDIE